MMTLGKNANRGETRFRSLSGALQQISTSTFFISRPSPPSRRSDRVTTKKKREKKRRGRKKKGRIKHRMPTGSWQTDQFEHDKVFAFWIFKRVWLARSRVWEKRQTRMPPVASGQPVQSVALYLSLSLPLFLSFSLALALSLALVRLHSRQREIGGRIKTWNGHPWNPSDHLMLII